MSLNFGPISVPFWVALGDIVFERGLMPKSEKLPNGFARPRSGSLRVQIRLKGQPDVVRHFPLAADMSDERQRQMAEAKSWAEETRRQMLADVRVSTR